MEESEDEIHAVEPGNRSRGVYSAVRVYVPFLVSSIIILLLLLLFGDNGSLVALGPNPEQHSAPTALLRQLSE